MLPFVGATASANIWLSLSSPVRDRYIRLSRNRLKAHARRAQGVIPGVRISQYRRVATRMEVAIVNEKMRESNHRRRRRGAVGGRFQVARLQPRTKEADRRRIGCSSMSERSYGPPMMLAGRLDCGGCVHRLATGRDDTFACRDALGQARSTALVWSGVMLRRRRPRSASEAAPAVCRRSMLNTRGSFTRTAASTTGAVWWASSSSMASIRTVRHPSRARNDSCSPRCAARAATFSRALLSSVRRWRRQSVRGAPGVGRPPPRRARGGRAPRRRRPAPSGAAPPGRRARPGSSGRGFCGSSGAGSRRDGRGARRRSLTPIPPPGT